MWTVGVRKTGNELGLDLPEVAALPASDLAARLAAATTRFEGVGAHFVVDSVADLPAILEDINARMAAGQSPL
jgi:phosphonoacetaldehyde hydrolase